jgi:hypothetical protein
MVGKDEYGENVDKLLYRWRRSRVRGENLRFQDQNLDLCIPQAHTSGFGRFSVRF